MVEFESIESHQLAPITSTVFRQRIINSNMDAIAKIIIM